MQQRLELLGKELEKLSEESEGTLKRALISAQGQIYKAIMEIKHAESKTQKN